MAQFFLPSQESYLCYYYKLVLSLLFYDNFIIIFLYYNFTIIFTVTFLGSVSIAHIIDRTWQYFSIEHEPDYTRTRL